MSLNENALATFAQAQAMFGYQATEETKVVDLINIASSRLEAHCKRRLAAQDVILLLDGTGCDTLLVPDYPINSVARLSVDASRSFAAETDIAEEDRSVRGESGMIILYAGSFGTRGARDVVRMEANVGFDEEDERRSILRAACLEYVDWMKSRFSAPGAIGKKGEYSADGVSVSYEVEMPLHIRAMVSEFVRAME